MITLSEPNGQSNCWQKDYAAAITSLTALAEILELPSKAIENGEKADQQFKLKVPLDYVDCIEKGNIDDPLLRQILPVDDENRIMPGFVDDPVGDLNASPLPGLIHKYRHRVLLVTTPACAIHCRYCFRRHYPYTEGSANGFEFKQAISYIESNKEISEVILSGGDPLSLADAQLEKLLQALETIDHVKTVRFHSRLAVTLPSRMTPSLKLLLMNRRFKTVMVVHCNHPNELSVRVRSALRLFADSPITLLNQSVLLAGVNDNAATLAELSYGLFESGVLPYYIHMLDPVQGAEHFKVSRDNANKIMKNIEKKLPGYLLPRLVEEVAGEASKRIVY